MVSERKTPDRGESQLMAGNLIQFLIAALVIVAAGVALAEFGNIIAHRTKLGGLLVGTLLVAGTTSLPELAVGAHAVRIGSPDIAVGDPLGSNLINLLILAVADLFTRSRGQMFSHTSLRHALTAGTSMGLMAVVAIFVFLGPRLDGVVMARIGPGSVVLVIAYLLAIRLLYRQRGDDEKSGETSHSASFEFLRRVRLKGAIIGFIVAGAAILAAAPLLAGSASELAESTGLGGTFFGSTFVAMCTGLTEVVTTIAAVRLKAFDMAVGNIFGSNCFNMMLLALLDFADSGSLLSSVSQTHVYTALCGIVITATVLLGQLSRVEGKKRFLEPDALLAIFLILGSMTGLYFLKGE